MTARWSWTLPGHRVIWRFGNTFERRLRYRRQVVIANRTWMFEPGLRWKLVESAASVQQETLMTPSDLSAVDNPVAQMWMTYVEHMEPDEALDLDEWCAGFGCALVLLRWWLEAGFEVDGRWERAMAEALEEFLDADGEPIN